MYDPIAYTYEADYHCPACATARFARGDDEAIPDDAFDSEGNPIGAIAPWDEWWDTSTPECQALACSDCGGILDNAHREACCQDPYGESACDLREECQL